MIKIVLQDDTKQSNDLKLGSRKTLMTSCQLHCYDISLINIRIICPANNSFSLKPLKRSQKKSFKYDTKLRNKCNLLFSKKIFKFFYIYKKKIFLSQIRLEFLIRIFIDADILLH